LDSGVLGFNVVREAQCFLSPLKNKGFKEERVTTMRLDDLGKFTTLESNKSVEEIFATLTPQELVTVRDLAEKTRESKLTEAKAAVLEEMKGKLSALGLSINDVVPSRRPRKTKSTVSVKYRSPDGETWSGRGHAPLWLRQLELQGHNREEYAVTDG
jgi:DNA-binding protein H-NS